MTVGQMSKMGLLTLVMAATAACGRSPDDAAAVAAGTPVQAAGFVFDNLMPGDVALSQTADGEAAARIHGWAAG